MPSSSKPLLLLVDDDATFSRVLGDALANRQYEVMTALNISQALMQARERPPAYAIVDLRLNEESGLNLIGKLREFNPGMKILVLTGYASIATAVDAIKLGADHYLAKPADVDEILHALHRDEPDPEVPRPVPEQTLSLRRSQWEHLQRVLNDHDGNISAAARYLGIHRRSLQRKLRKNPPRS